MTEKIFFVLFLLVVLSLLFIAVYTVPYNTDSLTYHLARVRMWTQNQSVSYYASWDARQVFYPPFSEYLILQTYLLSSSDLFINLISTFSYAISCLTIYAIGKELSLKKSSIYFSLFLFMMCPIAISISLTTQVDMLIVMWVFIFIYYVIRIMKIGILEISKQMIEYVILLSVVVGLGYISKSSIMLVYFPFIIWIFIIFIKKGTKIKLLLFYSFIALVTVLLITFPHLWRYIQFTNELKLYSGENALVLTYDIRYYIVNAYKNICITLFSKNGYLNNILFDFGTRLSRFLGINYASPIITWGRNLDSYYIGNVIYSNDAGTSMILMTTFMTLFIFRIKKLWAKKNQIVNGFLICSLISFLMVTTFVRFSIYQLRIVFSSLILLNIVTGCLINEINFKYKKIIIILVLLFNSISCYECVIYNWNYVDLHLMKWNDLKTNYNLNDDEQRNALYFPNNIPTYKLFKEFTDIINKHQGKNLALATDTYIVEYPIWCMVEPKKRISHIMLDSATQSSNLVLLENKNSHPELVLFYNKKAKPDGFIYNDKNYTLIWAYQNENDMYNNNLISLYEITN